MMGSFLFFLMLFFQLIIGFNLVLPLLLYIIHFFTQKLIVQSITAIEYDYAVIVTAYQQTSLLVSVVDSILKLNYKNYLIYVVADNCDISGLYFNDERVLLLRPEEVLSSNTKSHFYAISHFKRPHEYLTIIDSDNLVDSEYLNELNAFFNNGFIALQGVRKAKNLNTTYACLDEAGDMYYRFIDRKLLFEVGSSASLAGSGMAFSTAFYQECLGLLEINGAGFDKALQIEILKRGERIAFVENAVVFDEKTSKSNQLINQRARWINTWFKYAGKGLELIRLGVINLNRNQFICGLVFSRPPLFITVILSGVNIVIDLFFFPKMLLLWAFQISAFILIFFISLNYFKAPKNIYSALIKIPLFMFYQVRSLLKFKKANEISIATDHYFGTEFEQGE